METFKLNKDAKTVLGIIDEIIKKRKFIAKAKNEDFKEENSKIRFKEIINWRKDWDETIRRGLKVLTDLGIILKTGKKKSEIRYQLNPKYMWQALKIGRQNSDISELQAFPFKDIINLSTTKGKTTIYGLPEEVFHKSNSKSRTFDYDQKETLDFVGGIKAIDVLGKYFGAPLKIKINSNKQTSEEEIVNRQVEYYLDLLKQGAKPENLFRTIITTHRNSKITFNNLGENISNYLLELKRKHRRKRILESYNTKLKELSKGRLKSNLARFKQGFVGILAHTDHDEDFLKRSLFEFCGAGVGGYSYNENPKMFWSFHKFINSLKSKEKEILFDFLWNIFKENKELYPTNTAFICRAHSQDAFPEGIPFETLNK